MMSYKFFMARDVSCTAKEKLRGEKRVEKGIMQAVRRHFPPFSEIRFILDICLACFLMVELGIGYEVEA